MVGKTVPKKVLVVEDELLVSMMIADMLTDLGHDVIGTAANLASAVQKSSSLPVDFAILDVNLNGELSYPAADALVARGIPFVFATGYSSKGVQLSTTAFQGYKSPSISGPSKGPSRTSP